MAELSTHAPLVRRHGAGGRGKGSRSAQRKGEAQQATAAGLDLLRVLGWLVLHDAAVPDDPDTSIDHVLAGPSGVYVVNTVGWTGPISVDTGVLTVGGADRHEAVADVAAAAEVVRRLLGATPVAPLLCFERLETVTGVADDVALCASENILDLLTSQPEILDPASVARASRSLSAAFRPVDRRPVRAVPAVVEPSEPAVGPSVEELARARAVEDAEPEEEARPKPPETAVDVARVEALENLMGGVRPDVTAAPITEAAPKKHRFGLRRGAKKHVPPEQAPVELSAEASAELVDLVEPVTEVSAAARSSDATAVGDAGAALWLSLTDAPEIAVEPSTNPELEDVEPDVEPDVEAALAEAEARQQAAEADDRERAERQAAEAREREEQQARERAEQEAEEARRREADEARKRAAQEARENLEREARELAERERLERQAREQAEREEAERLARLEQERLEREAREQAEREEAERLARLERERLEREAREQAEREEAARLEQERLEREAREQAEREEAARLEQERLEQERLEQEAREQAERQEAARLARLEQERLEQEAREQAEREEAARLERERLEQERLEREAREQAEREKAERLEREAREQAEREEAARLEQERLEREAREQAEREEAERLERERAEEATARAAWQARLQAGREARARTAESSVPADEQVATMLSRHPDVRRAEVLQPMVADEPEGPAIEEIAVHDALVEEPADGDTVAEDAVEAELATYVEAEPEIDVELESEAAPALTPLSFEVEVDDWEPEVVAAPAARRTDYGIRNPASAAADAAPVEAERRGRLGHGLSKHALMQVAVAGLLIAGVIVGGPRVGDAVAWGQGLFAKDQPATVGTAVTLDATTYHPAGTALAGAPVPVQATAGAGAAKGEHLVAVPLRIRNDGTARWDVPVAAEAAVVDVLGVSHPVVRTVKAVKGYPLLPGVAKIAPGAEVTGYAVFSVPNGRDLRSVSLGLAKTGDDAVTWQVAP